MGNIFIAPFCTDNCCDMLCCRRKRPAHLAKEDDPSENLNGIPFDAILDLWRRLLFACQLPRNVDHWRQGCTQKSSEIESIVFHEWKVNRVSCNQRHYKCNYSPRIGRTSRDYARRAAMLARFARFARRIDVFHLSNALINLEFEIDWFWPSEHMNKNAPRDSKALQPRRGQNRPFRKGKRHRRLPASCSRFKNVWLQRVFPDESKNGRRRRFRHCNSRWNWINGVVKNKNIFFYSWDGVKGWKSLQKCLLI